MCLFFFLVLEDNYHTVGFKLISAFKWIQKRASTSSKIKFQEIVDTKNLQLVKDLCTNYIENMIFQKYDMSRFLRLLDYEILRFDFTAFFVI